MPNLSDTNTMYENTRNLYIINGNTLTINFLPNLGAYLDIIIKDVYIEVYSERFKIYEEVDDVEVSVYKYKNKKLYRTPRDGLYTSMFVDVYGFYSEFVRLKPKPTTISIVNNEIVENNNLENLSFLNDNVAKNQPYKFYYLYKNINTSSVKIINNDPTFPAKVITVVGYGPYHTMTEIFTYFIPAKSNMTPIPFTWALPYAIDGYYNHKVSSIYDGNNICNPNNPTTTL